MEYVSVKDQEELNAAIGFATYIHVYPEFNDPYFELGLLEEDQDTVAIHFHGNGFVRINGEERNITNVVLHDETEGVTNGKVTIISYNQSRITMWGKGRCEAWDASFVDAHDHCEVAASDHTVVRGDKYTRITLSDDATAYAQDDAVVVSYSGGVVARDRVRVSLYGESVGHLYDNVRSHVYGNSHVYAHDYSTTMVEGKNVIVRADSDRCIIWNKIPFSETAKNEFFGGTVIPVKGWIDKATMCLADEFKSRDGNFEKIFPTKESTPITETMMGVLLTIDMSKGEKAEIVSRLDKMAATMKWEGWESLRKEMVEAGVIPMNAVRL